MYALVSFKMRTLSVRFKASCTQRQFSHIQWNQRYAGAYKI